MRALEELKEVAERAIAYAQGEAQATAVWERGATTVEITCVIDGRAAAVRAGGTSDDELRRAARAAALHARRPRAWPSAGLPDPVAVDPGEAEEQLAGEPVLFAVASTRGVRSAWNRTRGPFPAPAPALQPRDATPVRAPAGELPVVLGPEAVGTVLDHLRPAFGVELDLASGPLHGRLGTRVAGELVTLTTPAGGFDAEGLPRRAVTLIDSGVAAGRVHDTASAARAGTSSTGHATRAAALAPLPEDLVLAIGDQGGIAELCAPVAHGLYIPALSAEREAQGDAFRHTTRAALLLRDGAAEAPLHDMSVLIDPLAVLAGVEALTRATRPVPLSQHGVADVPALRAGTGIRVG